MSWQPLGGGSGGGGGSMPVGSGSGEVTISSDTTETHGIINVDRYVVESGATLTIDSGVLMIVASTEIVIDGTVDGSGAVNSHSGGSGGSYINYAGDGGDGGAGGCGLLLFSPTVTVTGTINLYGEDGQNGQDAVSPNGETDYRSGADGGSTSNNLFYGWGGYGHGGNGGYGGQGSGDVTVNEGSGGNVSSKANSTELDSVRAAPFLPQVDVVYSNKHLVMGASGAGGGEGCYAGHDNNNAGGGGGGGGGSGGSVIIYSSNVDIESGTFNLSGGLGGTGGSGYGKGYPGDDGADGADGEIIAYGA